jgi:hypothetical protein
LMVAARREASRKNSNPHSAHEFADHSRPRMTLS